MIDFPADTQAIIFDCDGTLTDSMPLHLRAWVQTFQAHGIAFTERQFYDMAGMPSDKIIAAMSRAHEVQVDAAALAHEKEQTFLDLLHELQPLERVVEIARRERGRLKLAVASGGYRWVIEQQLVHIGIKDWFDTIVTAEDTQRHKPFPDAFLEAARRMQVEPTQCIVFEDADLGVEAARRAGMTCVDVRLNGWGSSSA